jgi:predicted metal-binding membrane protein
MPKALALDSILKRDRLMVLAGMGLLSASAWGYMVHEAHSMTLTGACRCAGLKMSGPDINAWSAATLLPLFLMWAEMMVAMMLPSAAPMILTFATVNRKRREQQRPFVSAAIFVLGYLLAWTGFSALAAVAQWSLHGAALLSPMMVSTSRFLGGGLLITAGVFQWTTIKYACLAHCRSPLSFLMTDWREGRAGALWMGLKHGAYCTGCCWFLMALLFVAGVMNLWWIAAISVLVLVEKIARQGIWIGKVAGVLLIVWGVWMLLTTQAT